MPEPEDLSDDLIADLASGMQVSRGIFGKAFDALAIVKDAPLFKQISVERNQLRPIDDDATRDLADRITAMKIARDGGWLVALVFRNFGALTAKSSGSAKLELQALLAKDQKFVSARDFEIGTLAATRRCCLIDWSDEAADPAEGNKGQGSGFLIGPNMVLTNFHVIESMLRPGTTEILKEGPIPFVVFDKHWKSAGIVTPETVACSSDWLVAASVKASEDATTESLSNRLDYAILRLSRPVGHARGWYDISHAPVPPDVGHPLEIWQFPDGIAMNVKSGVRTNAPDGMGKIAADAPTVPPRIFYAVNTIPGSSGSPVLDEKKTPVAIHEAGFEQIAGQDPTTNRGIPLTHIYTDARDAIDAEFERMPVRIGWHPHRHLPIIGRSDLQDLILRAQREDVRIIAVMTEPDPNNPQERRRRIGRTFTQAILEASLPHADHHIIGINAAQIDPDPFLTAKRIVARVDPLRVAELPEPSGETTLDADATGILVDHTVSALRASAPGKTVWLMIDDIDAHPIGTQWGSSSYLIALYRRAAVEPRLRIVLVGLPRPLEGMRDLMDRMVVAEENLEGAPSEDELRSWLDGNLTGRPLPAEFAPSLGRMIRSIAETNAEIFEADPQCAETCVTEMTSMILRRHLRSAFEAQE